MQRQNVDGQSDIRNENDSKQLQLTYRQFLTAGKSLLGLKLDKYYITEKLGQQTFQNIYKAINDQTNQEVVIKLINLRLIENEKCFKVKRIKQKLVESQSKIMMMFDSPYILKCYECFENSDFKIMVIEYCNEKSLQDKINTLGVIPEAQALSIIRQIINGVAQCHKKNVIHRDIKADNILIHNGVYKMADFGFSKQLKLNNQNEINVNTCLGTLTTMAPEVLQQFPYGLKADIWSIGMLLFQMIFGIIPYKANTKEKLLQEMKNLNNLIQNTIQFNGIRPSSRVRKFLCEVLVVNVQNRLGWRQVLKHQIFVNQLNQTRIGNQFQVKVQISQIDEQLQIKQKQFMISKRPDQYQNDDKFSQNTAIKLTQNIKSQLQEDKHLIEQSIIYEDSPSLSFNKKREEKDTDARQQRLKQQIYKTNDDIQNYSIQTQVLNQSQTQEFAQNKMIKRVPTEQIQQKRKQVTDQQGQLLKWAKRMHVQCLKTQTIYENIIQGIQRHKVFDLQKREIIQMMYLICTRCFKNISQIHDKYEKSKNKNNKVFLSLLSNVDDLYKKVKGKWQHYSDKLTKKENQKMSIFFDFTQKYLQPRQKKRKDKFLTGMQNYNESDSYNFNDYTQSEQISYTGEIIDQNIKYIKINDKQSKFILNYLYNFKSICRIKQEDVRNKNFDVYLKMMLL